MKDENLLPAELIPLLERMALHMNRRIPGSTQGKHRSKHIGASLDFADYRLYAPGDDLRQLDWNAYGRTGKPFVKLYLDEREMPVHLWVDASRSMEFSTRGGTLSKLDMAKRLAAAIGYMALCHDDQVQLTTFGERPEWNLPPLRGKGSFHRLQYALHHLPVYDRGDLLGAVRYALKRPVRPGLCWLFSDFLFESGIEEALAYLNASGQAVVLVHILSPDELSPNFSGDLRLIDVEDHSGLEVAISGSVMESYQQQLEDFIEKIRQIGF